MMIRSKRRAIGAATALAMLASGALVGVLHADTSNPDKLVDSGCEVELNGTPFSTQLVAPGHDVVGPDETYPGSTIEFDVLATVGELPTESSGIPIDYFDGVLKQLELTGATVTDVTLVEPAYLHPGQADESELPSRAEFDPVDNLIKIDVYPIAEAGLGVPTGEPWSTPVVHVEATVDAAVGETVELKVPSGRADVNGDGTVDQGETTEPYFYVTTAVLGAISAEADIFCSAFDDTAAAGGLVSVPVLEPGQTAPPTTTPPTTTPPTTTPPTTTPPTTTPPTTTPPTTTPPTTAPPEPEPEVGEYVALSPGRLLDTRSDGETVDGMHEAEGAQGDGDELELQVAGRHGVPADAEAVALNVTATDTSGPGYVAVYPCGDGDEATQTSNLNYVEADDTRPNAVFVGLSDDGTVCMTAAGAATELIADANGYFEPNSGFVAGMPARLYDSRDTGSAGNAAVAPSEVVEVQVGGVGDVPDDATAAALNVTAGNVDGPGYLTAYPCSDEAPGTSSVNFNTAGEFVPNAVVSDLSDDGTVCIVPGVSDAEIIVDVTGYFTEDSTFEALVPERAIDTRTDGGAPAVGDPLALQVAGWGEVPDDATAVAVNVTVTDTQGPGFVTVWPCGEDAPNASSVNFPVALTSRSNGVLAAVSDEGTICLQTGVSGADLVVDVVGYFGAVEAPEGA